MKKYLALYRSTVSAQEMMKAATEEQAKAGMNLWMAWMQDTRDFIVDIGSPLGESTVVGGSAGVGFIGGFTIVQADSLNAAKALFSDHPHFHVPGASVEILEFMNMPGM